MGRCKDDVTLIFWNMVASITSGLLGAMGFGGGGILIIYLTQALKYNQLKSQGINLMFFIPSAIIALIFHTKNEMIEFKKDLPYIISAVPGVIAGLYFTTLIKGTILSKIFGVFLLIIGIKGLFGKTKKD